MLAVGDSALSRISQARCCAPRCVPPTSRQPYRWSVERACRLSLAPARRRCSSNLASNSPGAHRRVSLRLSRSSESSALTSPAPCIMFHAPLQRKLSIEEHEDRIRAHFALLVALSLFALSRMQLRSTWRPVADRARMMTSSLLRPCTACWLWFARSKLVLCFVRVAFAWASSTASCSAATEAPFADFATTRCCACACHNDGLRRATIHGCAANTLLEAHQQRLQACI